MIEPKSIQIITEDKYGCNTFLSKFDNLSVEYSASMYKKYNINRIETARSGSNIFLQRKGSLKSQKIDYLILVLDMDSQDISNALKSRIICKSDLNKNLFDKMLLYDVIKCKFETQYLEGLKDKNGGTIDVNKSDAGFINITNPNSPDYIGDRVIVLPVYFCFESLLLYSKSLFSTLLPINIIDFMDNRKAVMDFKFNECLLAFDYFYNINKKGEDDEIRMPQKCIKDMVSNILLNKFSDAIKSNKINGKIFTNSSKIKKTHLVFNEIEKVYPKFVQNEIIVGMKNNAIFNKPILDLVEIKSDNDIDKFINKYCFSNYNSELEKTMNLYGQMLLWNPKQDPDFRHLSWFDEYTKYVESIYDIDKALSFINPLCEISTYYVEYYKQQHNYNTSKDNPTASNQPYRLKNNTDVDYIDNEQCADDLKTKNPDCLDSKVLYSENDFCDYESNTTQSGIEEFEIPSTFQK